MGGEEEERRTDPAGTPALDAAGPGGVMGRTVEAADAEPPVLATSRRADASFDLRAFLAKPDTQQYLRAVVRRRMGGAPDAVLDEIAQEVNVAALHAKVPPRAAATALGWLATIAVRAVVTRIRRKVSDARWFDREVDAAEMPDPTGAAMEEPAHDAWLLSSWLAREVAGNARDQETLELISYKSDGDRTYEQVAADHGITVPALKSRFHEFKKRYSSRWRQRQMTLVFLFGAGAVVLVAIACLLAWLLRPVPPVRSAPAPVPVAPTASAPPEPSFEPAAPRIPPTAKPRRP
jgi:DNA-directed RNA polymerase specialized sigma24 family protein